MANELETKAINVIRGLAMDAVQKANSGHPGTAMALAPLAHVLYTRIMRYDAAEPFRLLRADLPPTLILAGESDRFVHLERIRSIADAVTAAGSEVELIVAPFADHGFDGEPNSFGAQLSESLVPAFVFRVAPTSS